MGSVHRRGCLGVQRPDRTTLRNTQFTLVNSRRGAFPTSGYLVLVPLCREHAATLRIKVGTISRATPVSESTTRIMVDVSVADKVWFVV